MRKFAIVALIIIILLLSGCKTREYTFRNQAKQIERVELLYNPYANSIDVGGLMENICTLDGESAVTFWEELYQLDTHYRTTPGRNYGFYVAQVTYKNGDIEIFGSRHIEFIAKGESPNKVGGYAFKYDDFEELFCKYAGITSFEEDMAEREQNATTTAPSQ